MSTVEEEVEVEVAFVFPFLPASSGASILQLKLNAKN
jgi:hypothetical protein